ncbi:MAG: DUF4911 domain-containing protein [Candidatus Cloacimonetes bacterium]|nr:DUF4911 domain-containing protein [Candidatus Cloacimonadota bacterium]
MKFNVISRKKLNDETLEMVLFTPKEEVIVLGYILESFEGWFNYSTIDSKKQLFRVRIMKDYIDSAEELIAFLKDWSPPAKNFY